MSITAMKQALEALSNAYWPTESNLIPAHNIKECAEAITSLRQAIAESEKQPPYHKEEHMSITAMKHYEAALLEAFPRGASGDVFHHWNEARKAIAEAEKLEPVLLK